MFRLDRIRSYGILIALALGYLLFRFLVLFVHPTLALMISIVFVLSIIIIDYRKSNNKKRKYKVADNASNIRYQKRLDSLKVDKNKCPSCYTKNNIESKFCESCGFNLYST